MTVALPFNSLGGRQSIPQALFLFRFLSWFLMDTFETYLNWKLAVVLNRMNLGTFHLKSLKGIDFRFKLRAILAKKLQKVWALHDCMFSFSNGLWMNGTDDEDLVLDLEGIMFFTHFQNLSGLFAFSRSNFWL